MEPFEFEIFGDSSQIQLQQRYFRLWQYLQANSSMSFAGRTIGVDDPKLEDALQMAGLAKELGILSLMFVKPSIVDPLRAAFEEQELNVELWRHLLSNERSEARCRSVIETRQLPPGCRFDRITPETPVERMRAYQELMHRCGVAPPPGYYLRGYQTPIVAAMILNAQDEIVATGIGTLRHSPLGPFKLASHVGYLATDPDHRGQGLARLLLAHVMLASMEEFGAQLCHTGVRAENVASQKVCRDCGLEESGMAMMAAAYPPLLGRKRFTS